MKIQIILLGIGLLAGLIDVLPMIKKKLDKFEEVRNVQAQFDLGLISKEEMNAKISQLLN